MLVSRLDTILMSMNLLALKNHDVKCHTDRRAIRHDFEPPISYLPCEPAMNAAFTKRVMYQGKFSFIELEKKKSSHLLNINALSLPIPPLLNCFSSSKLSWTAQEKPRRYPHQATSYSSQISLIRASYHIKFLVYVHFIIHWLIN